MANFRYTVLFTVFSIVLSGKISFCQTPRDLVNGNLIQFNDNGFWCWYQDERAVVDMNRGKIILGSSASGSGSGGSARNGANDAVEFDLDSGTVQRNLLAQWSGNCDDHNAPGFIIRPDGKYLAMYDQHYDNYVTRYRIFDGVTWASEQTYDWRTKPGGIDYTLAYNNIYYLSAESRMYDFQRANHRAPNFLISTNMGDTWTWGGQLTTNTSSSYNKGYYKYWGNGIDRIDFIFTEQHPRDTTTSIYHGYIKGGKAYKSDGALVDNDIYDTTFIPAFWNFTKVFAEGTVMGGITMRRCWQADVMRYGDGTIATIITTRSNINTGSDASINPDHNFIYCRYDGASWSATYLGKAGKKMYSSEADYTGLGALCPNDPTTLYISTPNDPRDTSISLGVREIWKGVTANNGASWTWTPITQNSIRDNFRPIVPLWDGNNTALLWCRGTYTSAQSFDAAVVGILDRKLDAVSLMTYVDATQTNTTLSTGAVLTTTGPDAIAGAADGNWHQRTGMGNGSTLLTSAEGNSENAPTIRTRINAPSTGIYDIWVNFWADPASNWRIKAGLSTTAMQIFRSMACKQVQNGDHNTTLTLSGSGANLYQAYVGRVNVVSGSTIDVYIDDEATSTAMCTLYDGVSYASINGTPAVPMIAFSGTSISFGTPAIGTMKKDSIRVSNHGTASLQISAISSSNARFSFAPATITIAPSGSAYLVITFAPQDTSVQSGSIIITHNTSGSPDTIAVNGKGGSVPVIALSKTSIIFGTVISGTTKKDSIQISNSGTDTLRISAISSSNVRFTFVPVSMTLASSGNAYLVITFVPQDTSVQSGSIVLTYNALGSPDTITVSGKGGSVPVPSIVLSKTAINFGSVTIGTTKKDSIHVSNSGTDTLRVTAISSSNARFTFAPVSMTLAPSSSAYLVVTFAPPDTSVQSGLIIVTHNASGSPDTMSVTGKGRNVPMPMFALSGNTISYGTVTIGTTKKDSVQVSNPGTADLLITTISSNNSRFSIALATLTLAPSGSANLVVTFAPQDISVQSGSIILTHNASGSLDTIVVGGKGSSPVAVERDKMQVPTEFALSQNYPNPFNPTTKISYSISKSNFVTLKIFNVLGREIQTLVNKYQEPHRYSIEFNANKFASGIYFYQLKAGNDFTEIKKMILMK